MKRFSFDLVKIKKIIGKTPNKAVMLAVFLAIFIFANWLILKPKRPKPIDKRVPEVKNERVDAYQIKNGEVHYRQSGNMRKVKEADPETFIALDENYGKDKDHAYFRNFPIEGADAKTFEPIDELWSKDGDKAFCSRVSVFKKIMEEADAETLEKVGKGYYKDKDNVFKDCHISEIPDIDPETFEIVDENTVKDKNGTYDME